MSRSEHQNSLTPDLIDSLIRALHMCEHDPSARALIIQGTGGYFSSGMDIAAAGAAAGSDVRESASDAFLELLRRITLSRVVVVSIVDGMARGGGLGIAAASDFVFATPRSRFSMPEILWGLLPCAIAPFLIRRMGFQACQKMTLSTLPIDVETALRYGLVDAIGDTALPRLLGRLEAVAQDSIGAAKQYLSRIWILDEAMLDAARGELDSLLASPVVAQRFREFAVYNRYPWEKRAEAVAASEVVRTTSVEKRAWLFPGQGTQRRGMGRDLFDMYPNLVEAADDILGYSIRSVCLDDPNGVLGRTEYCQPAIYVVSALMFLKQRRCEPWPDIFAGHSLGEYSALFAAGAFDFETGLRLVQRRGQLMAEARRGAMLAVIGPTIEQLEALLDELGLHELDVANFNLPTQTVLSGPDGDTARLANAITSRDLGRAVRLHISGASHGRIAEPVARVFEAELARYDLGDPAVPTISNVTGRPYAPGTVRELLAQQMRSPVRWVETMKYLRSQGVTEARQIGPGRVLDALWEGSEGSALVSAEATVAGTGGGAGGFNENRSRPADAYRVARVDERC